MKQTHSMFWCSQAGCVHGAVFTMNVNGKPLCIRCADLLYKDELTRLDASPYIVTSADKLEPRK